MCVFLRRSPIRINNSGPPRYPRNKTRINLFLTYSPIYVHIFQGWSYITHLRGRYICIYVMKVMDQGFVLRGGRNEGLSRSSSSKYIGVTRALYSFALHIYKNKIKNKGSHLADPSISFCFFIVVDLHS